MAVIEVGDLRKSYGATTAVDGVSFEVARGEIFAIVGPNGAGKTSIVESIAGLRRPDGGTIRVLGMDPHRQRAQLAERIGVQLQDAELPARLRVGEALDLYASFYRRPADRRRLLDDWGLTDKVKTAYADLSGGQRQRLFVALAFIGNPELVILDELTTGLDPQARRATWGLIKDIRSRGLTVVLVTHFMEEAEQLADRVAIIDRGRIAALNRPTDLVNHMSGELVLSFRPMAPIDLDILRTLPGIRSVTRSGEEVIVHGDADVLAIVSTELARRGVLMAELRVDRTTLDDVFVAMTPPKRRGQSTAWRTR